MKRLIIIRHAKSDWSDLTASDHERTLNARGRESAKVIGGWMRELSYIPDHILCSDAARTCETLSLLRLGDVHTTFARKLYLAEPAVMADLVKDQKGVACIAVIAHNPGSAMLAEALLKTRPTDSDFSSYPTGATAVIDFDIEEWSALRSGTGKLIDFIVPRDLMKK